MKTANSFNQNFKRFEEARESLRRHARSSIKSLLMAKKAAYKMAFAYFSMQKSDHSLLLELIMSDMKYKSAKEPITAWIDDSFAPLGLCGADHYLLIKAVHDGMTLKQYLAQEPAIWLAAKRVDAKRAQNPFKDLAPKAGVTATLDRVPTPADPQGDTTETVKQLREQVSALKSRLAESERERKALVARCATLEQAMKVRIRQAKRFEQLVA